MKLTTATICEESCRISAGVGLVAFLLTWLVLLMPWTPDMPLSGLDPSWKEMMLYAFAHHLRYGRDLLWVDGPLGFAAYNFYYPGTHLWVLFIRGSILSATGFFCFQILRNAGFFYGLFASLVLLLALTPWYNPDPLYYCVAVTCAILLLSAEVGIGRGFLLALLAAAVALMKFTYFIELIAIFVVSTLYRTIRLKEYPFIFVTFLAGYLGLYAVAGEQLVWLPTAFRGSLGVMATYSEAFQLPGPLWPVCEFLLLFGGWILMMFAGDRSKGISFALCRAAAATLISFMLFKEAIVRERVPHLTIGFAGLTVAIVLFTADSRKGTDAGLIKAGSVFLSVVAAFLFYVRVAAGTGSFLFFPSKLVQTAVRNMDSIKALASVGERKLEIHYQQALSNIRSQYPLSPARGSVDIYPADDNAALANWMQLKPRPMFQSVTATERFLIRRNVRFLEDSGAPDTIFFQVWTVDHRLPALDDGASWPVLLARYRIRKEAEASYLRLDRLTVPEPYKMLSTGWATARLNGNDVQLPQNCSLCFAKFRLKRSPVGRILSVVFKLPIIWLNVRLQGGTIHRYRVIPGPAKAGFILSPLVETNGDFAGLHEPPFPKCVKAIRFATSKFGLLAYSSRVRISFYRLDFATQKGPLVVGLRDSTKLKGWQDLPSR